MTDKPTDEALENLFVEETGFATDDFPAAIFDFALAVLAKWGQPAVAGEPVAWMSPGKERLEFSRQDTVYGSHTIPLYATPQPTQPDSAYSAACHLATVLFKKHFAHLPDFASGQAVWSLCDSTAGVISQIDNLVAGLVQPPTTSPQADSVQEDAALWHWLAEYLVGTRTDLDDEIVASETVNDLRKLVKAAIKQGASHDNS